MISLTDLRARQIVPAWQEAVAVIQELVQGAVQAQGRDARLPDVDHIALIANGEVVALPGSADTGNPVSQAARLLQLMLEGVAAPPELRALADDNATDVPKLPTLAELSRQLAFFERPGRRSDVEQLVARAMSADAQNRAEEELRRLKERTLAGSELDAFQSELPPPPQPQRAGRQGIVVLAFLLVGAAAAGAWWMYASGGGSTPGASTPVAASAGAEVQAAGSEAAPAGGADRAAVATSSMEPAPEPAASTEPPSLFARTAESIRRVVQSAFGSNGSVEPEPAAEPAPSTGSAPAAQHPRPRRAPAAGNAATASAAAPRTEPPQISTVVTEPPMEGEPLSIGSVSEARSMVYSQDDHDVRPAVLLRPVLPATPPPDVPPDQIGTLELIVDEHGDVERVRLISPSNRFHERMLVAHAKSWKFRPAIRDGRPVKYRTVVRLTI